MPSNDNGSDAFDPQANHRDAHGQAALILVESLIHGLLSRSVLTTHDAVEIIDTAKDVQADVAEAADGAGAKMWRSHALLCAMSESLRHDMLGPAPDPL